MTLRIDISGELEAALTAEAHERGLSLDQAAQDVLARVLTPSAAHEEIAGGSTGEVKARAFVEWASGHRYTPPLPDAAVSRSSMYPDRW